LPHHCNSIYSALLDGALCFRFYYFKRLSTHPITEQIELLFSIKTGSFPLYAPVIISPLLKCSHIRSSFPSISHIASLMPGYWNGKALECNTFFAYFNTWIYSLALFSFLRQLRLNTLFLFVLSLITVYNLVC